MKRIKESKRDQGILFSTYYVGDRLPVEHPVYLYESLIRQLDIKPILSYYSKEGGSMFSPKDQIAILVYAYLNGIDSSNKISELTAVSLPYIYLAGGYHIKARTIRDFRIKHRETLLKLFQSSTELAQKVELIDLSKEFALDGSKFEANASFSKTLKKKEWQEKKDKILEKVETYLRKWEENDENEEKHEEEKKDKFDKIKEKLEKLGANKNNIKVESNSSKKKDKSKEKENKSITRKKIVKVNSIEKAEKLLNEYESINKLLANHVSQKDDSFLSLTDPDCRVMQNDSTTKECYNVQTITNNQVIVTFDVTQDENDQAQLEPMVEKLKENIKISNYLIKLIADAGYNRGKNLEYLDNEKNIDSFISMYDRQKKKKEKPFMNENFLFDEEKDHWLCPRGKILDFIKEHVNDNKHFTLYGCEKEHCLFCSDKDQCITTKDNKKRGYRTIDDDSFIVYRQEMIEKMSNPKSKKIYKKRCSEVEAVYGQIKKNRGFKGFKLRGISKVKAEFAIMSIAHNMSKIMKHITKNPNLAVKHGI